MKQLQLKLTRIVLGIFFISGLLTGCKKSKTSPEANEEEVITTLKLTFTPVSGGPALIYQYKDADGLGGAVPIQDEIVLAPSTTYSVTLQLLNEIENPAEDITAEIEEEADAHRFYYEPSAGSNITVTNLNNDTNGIPLGITTTWSTGSATNGTIAITLRHYGGNPPGKAIADPVNSPKSSTDIAVTFNTKIQ